MLLESDSSQLKRYTYYAKMFCGICADFISGYLTRNIFFKLSDDPVALYWRFGRGRHEKGGGNAWVLFKTGSGVRI
jgi:hypothetical protein